MKRRGRECTQLRISVRWIGDLFYGVRIAFSCYRQQFLLEEAKGFVLQCAWVGGLARHRGLTLEAALDAAQDRPLEIDLWSRLCCLARPVDGAFEIALAEQAQLWQQ